MASRNPAPAKVRWYNQVAQTYSFTKEQVSNLGIRLLGTFVATFAGVYLIGLALDMKLTFGILGASLAILATLIIFGRIAEKAAYKSIEGQPGAAAAVLNTLKGNWTTNPGVGVDKNQNLVHRVVGRPGIILVGEGTRPEAVVAEQRKAIARFLPGVPVHEVIVDQNGVTIVNLLKTLRKMKKELKNREVLEVRRRVEALPKAAFPIPKGPMPLGRKMPRR
jgi:ABC-type multidrug transport system fused ATPase/permease subunit